MECESAHVCARVHRKSGYEGVGMGRGGRGTLVQHNLLPGTTPRIQYDYEVAFNEKVTVSNMDKPFKFST